MENAPLNVIPLLQGHHRIAREFRRDPLRLGYNTTSWTVALLATHLKTRYGGALTARTLRRRMKQMGLRWKRPRYVYAQKAPHIAQKKGCCICKP